MTTVSGERAAASETVGCSYLDRAWRAGGTGFDRVNPADHRDRLGPFAAATPTDVDDAVAAAERTAQEWARVPAPVRGDAVAAVGAVLRVRADELAAALTREEGKTLAEAKGEIEYAASVFAFIGGAGRWVQGATTDSAQPGAFVLTRGRPLGVVAALTPWNFPISLPAIKIASALVAGNAVVWKPASFTPLSAIGLMRAVLDAGVPAGVLSMLLGDGAVGRALVADPRVAAVSFTGSTAVGRAIGVAVAHRGARAQLEMGGKNAVIVLEDADLEKAAADTALAAFQSAGQKCTAASRVIVPDAVHDAFLDALVAATRRLVVGDPTDPRTDVGPVVHPDALEVQRAAIAAAVDGGARLVTGGDRLTGDLAGGNYLAPTVLAGIDPGMPVARKEIFGPVLSVLRVRDAEEAVTAANATTYGLAASVYTRDLGAAFAFADRVHVGKFKVNSSPTGGDLHVPFGGWKDSGAGPKELGPTALSFFVEEQTVYVNHGGGR
jgi:aldehyde dehydrogenase (NAD+)